MTFTALQSAEERDVLRAAFHSFDQAAQTLQQSYGALTARVEQMDQELAHSNDALRRQLSDNEAMRIHLDSILESLSTGVLVLDGGGVIARSNAPAAQMLGITAADLCGRRVTDVLELVGLSLCEHPQRIGQSVVAITRSPLKTQSGCGPDSLLLIQDMTRVYHLEEQLQRRDRLAAMGEMIGRIAHEIRNPLGSIELFASLLRRELGESASGTLYAEQISQAVRAMDGLLANLLVYTKPVRTPHGWHQAEPLVLDALSLAAHAISRVPVDIRLDLDPGIPSIWCHEGQMKQVLLNLIVNGVQAMPTGGVLTIRLERDEARTLGGPSVRLTVRDSGTGIDPAHRSRLFDPFFTTKEEGTGLGLAIVYAIVEAHHGRIDIESIVGQGASFAIVLPYPVPIGLLIGERVEAPSDDEDPAEQESAGVMLVEEQSHG
jgi:signal transduction histidine kinase